MEDRHTNVSTPADRPRIGLCLSGGGFRAALYALGVVRYLAEAGQLPNVKAVSAVSGGSIAAAVLGDRWPALASAGFAVEAFRQEVEAPFEATVANHNIRNEALRRWAGRRLTFRGPARSSVVGGILAERLIGAERLVDLDPALQVVLTSTDLGTGRAFRMSQEFVGSYDFGYPDPPADLRVGEAIAASAAVPMLFPPVHLATAGMGLTKAPATLSLTDGGVYDNLGLEWFQGWKSGRPSQARAVDFVIVVDASGVLAAQNARFRGVAALSRTRDIQYFQTRATRIRWFVEKLLRDEMRGIYLVTKYPPQSFRLPDGRPIDPALYDAALPATVTKALAGLRTDLDTFSTTESALLRYHGYWSMHARLKALHPALAVAGPPDWRDFASLPASGADELLIALSAGARRRMSRPRTD
jgi:NTE family protein